MRSKLTIKLVRHGQSQSNTGEVDVNTFGDHLVKLTKKGYQDSIDRGKQLASFLSPFANPLVYVSPYKRTRQTLDGIYEGCEIKRKSIPMPKIYEDLRLREVEWSLGTDDPNYWEKIESLKEEYGSIYVRRPNGESCADCFDRCSSFVDSMMRQVERKESEKVLIVSHGLTIRCFVMRFMHLTVAEFETLRNPANLDVITISNSCRNPQFTCGRWGVTGLRVEPSKYRDLTC